MRSTRLSCAAVAVLLISASGLLAQNGHVEWQPLTPEISGKPGEIVNVQLQFTTAPGAQMYGFRNYDDQIFGPVATTVGAGGVLALSPKNPVTTDVPPTAGPDAHFANMETEGWEGTVIMTVPVRIAEDAKPGEHEGWVNVNYMTHGGGEISSSTDAHFTILVRVQK